MSTTQTEGAPHAKVRTVRRWVSFRIGSRSGFATPVKGFEGVNRPLPIDRLAELVLSSTVHPIKSISVGHTDGVSVEYTVLDKWDGS